MPARPDCPERSVFEEWLVGRLSGPVADDLERHLDTCERCAATLRSLTTEDALSRALRPPLRPDETPYRDLAAAVVPALKQLRPRDPTVTWGEAPGRADDTRPLEPRAAGSCLPDAGEWVGGYALLGPLGAGGMGVVFRAEDPVLKRRVAVKLIQPALVASADARARFLREAQALASLEHDHIVTVFQAGEHNGVLFLAMPLLRGQTLQQRLDEAGGPLPTDEVLRIGREIAAGLAAAHARELVHRDIKPGNIWLEEADPARPTPLRVKILDFGLVQALSGESASETTGKVLGTPAYMAPEQAAGKPVDGRADLFSLGCVLYRLAAGRPPFTAPDLVSLILRVTLDEPTSPRELNPDIPVPVEQLILRLLRKNPDDRPPSAAAVAGEIARIEDELRPKPSRRKWLLGTAAAVAVTAVAAVLLAPKSRETPPVPGEVTFEYDQPDARIALQVGGESEQVVDLKTEKVLSLPPGEYAVRAVGGADGQFLWPSAFVVTPGEKQSVVLDLVGLAGKHKPHSPHAVGGIVLREEADRLAVLSVGHDRCVVAWDPTSQERPRRVLDPAGPFRCAALSPDRKVLAVGLGDVVPDAVQAVRFRNPATLEPLKGEYKARDGGMINALAYSPDGRFLFVGQTCGALSQWDTKLGVAEFEQTHCSAGIHAIACGADGKHVLTAGGDGTVAEWAAADLKPVRKYSGATGIVRAVAALPGGKRFASAGDDKTVRVWDREAGQVVATWAAPEPVHALAVSPDGARLVTGDTAGGVRLWDLGTGKEVIHFAGHSRAVTAAVFTRGGRRVVSGDGTGEVRLWLVPR